MDKEYDSEKIHSLIREEISIVVVQEDMEVIG
jgi:hypothetical protein